MNIKKNKYKGNSTKEDNAYLKMDLLRLTTAGSVDDGKSTLIGRLLYDTKSIFQDQYEAIERTSEQRGEGYTNLALLTDGLRAEREQNITIDVAYRYFATPKRKFIIGDTPGHVQYTRNMVTGASTAELAIVLVDARKGVLTQSKRHGFIASLLQIPHVIVAVNKMDLVDYSEEVFNNIVADYQDFAQKLEVDDITFIPISALNGDNVVNKSQNMDWYDGATLLHKLETVNVGANRNLVDFRLPVQYVVRPHQDFRGFAGQLSSGTINPGEEIMVLPARTTSKVKAVYNTSGEEVQEASAKESILLTLEDEVDISRGDMIVRKRNVPEITNSFEAYVCWLSNDALNIEKTYIIRHTTREAQLFIDKLYYKIDVDTLHRINTNKLDVNEIGRVALRSSQTLFIDPYKINHNTGSFIIIDPASNVTVGAGMIRHTGESEEISGQKSLEKKSSDVVWEGWNIAREAREAANNHKAAVLWFTGLSGSGKSTIAKALERKLFENDLQTMLLDGDNLRHGLCGDLGFSDKDRIENIRRVSHLAKLMFEQGNITLCTFISPFKKDREMARQLLPKGRFFEVFVNCPVEVCQERDPKGLYKKAIKGEIQNFTGISSPYEKPESPELIIDTHTLEVNAAVDVIFDYLKKMGMLL